MWKAFDLKTVHSSYFHSRIRSNRENTTEENISKPDRKWIKPESNHLKTAKSLWIKENQKGLHSQLKEIGFKALSPFTDVTNVIRVGEWVSAAVVSYDTKHPALHARNHWISKVITRHEHENGHAPVASAVDQRSLWVCVWPSPPKLVRKLKRYVKLPSG